MNIDKEAGKLPAENDKNSCYGRCYVVVSAVGCKRCRIYHLNRNLSLPQLPPYSHINLVSETGILDIFVRGTTTLKKENVRGTNFRESKIREIKKLTFTNGSFLKILFKSLSFDTGRR